MNYQVMIFSIFWMNNLLSTSNVCLHEELELTQGSENASLSESLNNEKSSIPVLKELTNSESIISTTLNLLQEDGKTFCDRQAFEKLLNDYMSNNYKNVRDFSEISKIAENLAGTQVDILSVIINIRAGFYYYLKGIAHKKIGSVFENVNEAEHSLLVELFRGTNYKKDFELLWDLFDLR